MDRPRLVIFDLDNTLYREPPELSRACEEAMARAAADMVEGLTYEAALYISQTSNHQTGSVRTYFTERYEIDPAALHERYHEEVDHLILPVCQDTRAAFAEINQEEIALGLLTHGSRGWTDRVLGHLGLSLFFPEELRIAIEDVDFEHKHESEKPFLEMLQRADVETAQAVMVEDVSRNLQVAHQMGMQTVLITHGFDLPAEEHIHHQAENVASVIHNFLA